MKKKTGAIIGSILVVIVIAIVGLYQYGKTLIPYYNNTSKNIVLLSNKENKLNDEQIDEFYNIARGALTSHDKDLNFNNLDDYSLYVEKIKGEKGKYFINYICENPTTKLRFENKIEVVLQNDKIGSDDNFLYEILKSDLLEFVGSPLKNSVDTSTIGTAETTSSSDSSNSNKIKKDYSVQFLKDRLAFEDFSVDPFTAKIEIVDNAPVLIFDFDWYNQSFPKTTTFLSAGSLDAFQGDTLLEQLDTTEGNMVREVAVGSAATVEVKFKLLNTEQPIKINFVDNQSGGQEVKSVTLTLENK